MLSPSKLRLRHVAAAHQIALIDLTRPKSVSYVSEQVSATSPG